MCVCVCVCVCDEKIIMDGCKEFNAHNVTPLCESCIPHHHSVESTSINLSPSYTHEMLKNETEIA